MLLDRFKKLNLKNKITASLVGFALILFCLIYFIVMPTVRDIKSMGQDIEDQRIDLEKKYIKGYSLKQLMENLKKIQPKLSLLDQIFINKNRELEFITALENEAGNAQVSQKVNLNSPQDTKNKEFQKSGLQLYARGGFKEELKYLLSLETSNYYINVKSLELTPGNSDNNGQGSIIGQTQEKNSNINMSINADIYWQQN